ncbi:MAG: WG repeat-containing protein, partial [Gracilibacteraceae bacterium]|nr:WG repeat-containing protein [Gracilibacteraceae bacterium]
MRKTGISVALSLLLLLFMTCLPAPSVEAAPSDLTITILAEPELEFTSVDPFWDRTGSEAAVVVVDDKQGLVDKYGKNLIPVEFYGVGSTFNWSEGVLYEVNNRIDDSHTQSGLYTVSGSEAEELLPCVYDDINGYYRQGQNMWVRLKKDGKYGLYDISRQEILLECIYDEEIKVIPNGRFIVKENGKYGVINNNGQTVVDFAYDYLANINLTQYLVKKDGQYKIIDQNQNTVRNYTYTKMEFFADNLAVAWDGAHYGVVDTSDRTVLSFVYDEIKPYSKAAEAAVARKDGKYGAVSSKGDTVVESVDFRYDNLINNYYY